MAKAIATYQVKYFNYVQCAIRADGVCFERKEVKGHYGSQMSKWKRSGSFDINDLPDVIPGYTDGGRQMAKDDSPANYRLPN